MIVYGVCLSPSGYLISVSHDGTIRRWHPTLSSVTIIDSSRQCSLCYEYDANVVSDKMAMAHDGHHGIS